MTFDVALRVADDVLRQGIQGISELITRPGLVNLDFASIRAALERAGGALMAIGRGQGEQKAVQAAHSALHSPEVRVPDRTITTSWSRDSLRERSTGPSIQFSISRPTLAVAVEQG